MKLKIYFTVVLMLTLVGCMGGQVQKEKNASVTPVATGVPYEPQGREQFVINTLEPRLQKYGILNFFSQPYSTYRKERLDHDKYAGMKGYFESMNPPPPHTYSGYSFFSVVLENGERFYYRAEDKRDGIYNSKSTIVPLEQFNKAKNSKNQPLVPKSDIIITKTEIHSFRTIYYTNTGHAFSEGLYENELEEFRDLAALFGNNSEIVKLLLGMNIKYEPNTGNYFIRPTATTQRRSEARLYIGVRGNKEWLRFRFKYHADDLLYVNAFKIFTDNFSWQSPKMTFKQGELGNGIKEWVDMPVTSKMLDIANRLSEAKYPVVRFQGKKYYKDEVLRRGQQEGIKKILRLYILIKQA